MKTAGPGVRASGGNPRACHVKRVSAGGATGERVDVGAEW